MEKQSEFQLRTLLEQNKFNKEYLFNSPSENEILKDLFKNSSKSGDGCGIPDCIYFDGVNLIIMECKSHSLTSAQKDYHFYYNSIKDKFNGNIYGIAFVNNNNYSVFKEKIEVNKILNLETFMLKENILEL